MSKNGIIRKKERGNQDEKSVKPLFEQFNDIWTGESSNRRCYFILHQPKVPENLKKFSESKK